MPDTVVMSIEKHNELLAERATLTARIASLEAQLKQCLGTFKEVITVVMEEEQLRAQTGRWMPVPNGDVEGYNMRIESYEKEIWRIWLGGAAIIFPPEFRLCRWQEGSNHEPLADD